MEYIERILIIGLVATVVMDLWGLARQPLLGMPAPDYRPVGRWILRMSHGQFVHRSIAAVPGVRGEAWAGWGVHYLTGFVFAAVMLASLRKEWIASPTLLPALGFGLVTVVVPFFVMQPAMGAGIAGSRTPRPAVTRVQSLLTHGVFGVGLYVGGCVARLLATAP